MRSSERMGGWCRILFRERLRIPEEVEHNYQLEAHCHQGIVDWMVICKSLCRVGGPRDQIGNVLVSLHEARVLTARVIRLRRNSRKVIEEILDMYEAYRVWRFRRDGTI